MKATIEIQQLEQMIMASVSPYHCILESIRQLSQDGFEELSLADPWTLETGNSYYINAFDSTLLAFTIGSRPKNAVPTLRIAASHTDWPCLKLKPSPEVHSDGYGKLNVEVYGGPIFNTWLDRPLSMAGKVCIKGKSPFEPEVRFVDFKRPLLTIPNLSIHMNREVNTGVALNPQTDLLPLLTMLNESCDEKHYFLNLLAKEAGTEPSNILDYEIYIYSTEAGMLQGMENEFYSSPRLDNLTSVQACISGLVSSGLRSDGINVIALYDNEEIGSRTKQGAASALMNHVLEKLYLSLGYSRESFLNALLGGFLLSIDVAHALHPNHKEKYDIKNHILPGDGIALKMAASQAYATDSSSVSVIESICQNEKIPYKKFSNRSDVKGGSTLGSISSCLLTMRTVDIGIPLLAMHSAREMMGTMDQTALVKCVEGFFV